MLPARSFGLAASQKGPDICTRLGTKGVEMIVDPQSMKPDDATWVLTSSFVIFTMQTGESF